jgi:glycosyltransferase involved in cell wall biosynthesis
MIITYAMWGELARAVPFIPLKIIEMQDMVTLNDNMQGLIRNVFQHVPVDAMNIDDEYVNENFFNEYNVAPNEVEYTTYDQFDITLAISSTECELVKLNTQCTKALYLPMAVANNLILKEKTHFDAGAVMVIGSNLFNYQGYVYWVKKVLPLIKREVPDFVLEVYGDGCKSLVEAPGTHLNGFVENLESVYGRASFAVCPLLGGTGQQVKVIEAMAYGLPVVVMRNVAGSSPVEHGVNGFIASTSEEFAQYCLMLHQDEALCSKMGRRAQQAVHTQYSKEKIKSQLLVALEQMANVS